ncbi:glycosyl hydrolase family 8 [Clostridium sp.]|uniref:glycosyl hydrolase family 8 n=1 Tax=Clostridium sp. TaxID=1506 RepID=UPI0034646148
MRKKLLLITIPLIVAVSMYFLYPLLKPIDIQKYLIYKNQSSESNALENFIVNNLTNEDGGILTNYLDASSEDEITKGHAVLSESQGLMMVYSSYIKNEEMFNTYYKYVKDNMYLSNGLISWRVSKDKEKSDTTAFIDDIRIAKALALGYKTFDKYSYRLKAHSLSKSLLENSISNDLPIDFIDKWGASSIFTLCYGDLEGMNILSSFHPEWKTIKDKSKEVMLGGLIGNTPFFKKSYDVSKGEYSKEENTELLYSLMVWESLLSDGEDIYPIINFMEKEMNTNGYLVTEYSKDLTPLTNIESASIYAVALRLSDSFNNEELSQKLENKLLSFMVKDGEFKGGLGYEKNKEFYSFDNIEGLLSLLNN